MRKKLGAYKPRENLVQRELHLITELAKKWPQEPVWPVALGGGKPAVTNSV